MPICTSGTQAEEFGAPPGLRRAYEVAGSLEGAHPSVYIQKAAELYRSRRHDEATFLYYLGQLRYRIYLRTHPDLPPDRDPALFSSLVEVVGRPVNEYAAGDIPSLVKIIQAVLDYDEANPDPFNPKAARSAQRADTRNGLADVMRGFSEKADDIRAQRAKNGLENRTR